MRALLESLEDERLFSTCGEALSVEVSVWREVTQGQAPNASLQGQVSLYSVKIRTQNYGQILKVFNASQLKQTCTCLRLPLFNQTKCLR